jgi:hypothetical protein
MFFFWIPCHKLYKEGVISYVFTLKYTCHFGMNSKKFNPKSKIKNKKCIFTRLLSNSSSLLLSYLLAYLRK